MSWHDSPTLRRFRKRKVHFKPEIRQLENGQKGYFYSPIQLEELLKQKLYAEITANSIGEGTEEEEGWLTIPPQ